VALSAGDGLEGLPGAWFDESTGLSSSEQLLIINIEVSNAINRIDFVKFLISTPVFPFLQLLIDMVSDFMKFTIHSLKLSNNGALFKSYYNYLF